MYDEDVCIYKSSPVVYTLKIETGLDAFIIHPIQLVSEISAVFIDGRQETHAGIIPSHTIFGE